MSFFLGIDTIIAGIPAGLASYPLVIALMAAVTTSWILFTLGWYIGSVVVRLPWGRIVSYIGAALLMLLAVREIHVAMV